MKKSFKLAVLTFILLWGYVQQSLAAPTTCPEVATGYDEAVWTNDGITVTGPFLYAGIMRSTQSIYCFYGFPGDPVTPYLRNRNFTPRLPIDSEKWVKTNCKIDTPCYKCTLSASECQFESQE